MNDFRFSSIKQQSFTCRVAEVSHQPNMEAPQRFAVVTGGNKGIGLEICRQLACNKVQVVLAARDEKKGADAVENLKKDAVFDVMFHQLDVQDPVSVALLVEFVESTFGKLDILVNNAAIGGCNVDYEALDAYLLKGGVVSDENAHLLTRVIDQTCDMTKECIETNYYGTRRVTEAFIPLLQKSKSARIVNLSSLYGNPKFIKNEKVNAVFEDINSLTTEKIDEILKWFLRDMKEDNLQANGWPLVLHAYKVSKAAVNAYTRLIARNFLDFRINCVHPGRVQTDLSGNRGNLTPAEGARHVVRLALLPDDGPSGLYFDEMNAST